MNARSTAARILADVIAKKKPLDRVMPNMLESLDKQKDQAYAQELCYGVLRWYPRLSFILDGLLDKPLRSKDRDITCLLLCGLYQLTYMRTPDHAAVSATVDATKKLNKSWANAMVNAVLRRYQREQERIQQSLQNSLSSEYAHPLWLIEQIRVDWPQHWQDILRENNERPPMHLRVNARKTTRDDYLNKLKCSDLSAVPSSLSPAGIHLTTPVDVKLLPGFTEGEVSVQDVGAQLVPELLDVKAGQRVLDACAAPGGKTAHIYETQNKLDGLVAVEINDDRLARLKQTLDRLEVDAEIFNADAADTESWWDGNQFDRILLDVPCSATGVIRRHPDIKILREPSQMQGFTGTQSQLLENIWPLLKVKGLMVYATCSILQQENDIQIEKFSSLHKDVQVVEIHADWGLKTRFGRQTLPTHEGTDGFYYAVLKKLAN